MPLQNYQYDTIMREYNRRQARNRRIQEEHLAEAYEKIPRLREIDEEVATLSARKARALISRQEVGIEDLRNDIALLSQERTALLLSSGYPADYLEMSYTCLFARILAISAARNAPVSRRQRSNFCIHSQI